MKIEMSNRELFEVIEKAVDGDVKAKFEILIKFEPIINSESYIKGIFSQECKDYIEDKVFEYIEKFKTIKEIKNILK